MINPRISSLHCVFTFSLSFLRLSLSLSQTMEPGAASYPKKNTRTRFETLSLSLSYSPLSRACDECKKRKTKCNGGFPCDKCVEHGRVCTYTMPVKKRGPMSGYLNSLVETIETLKGRLGDYGSGPDLQTYNNSANEVSESPSSTAGQSASLHASQSIIAPWSNSAVGSRSDLLPDTTTGLHAITQRPIINTKIVDPSSYWNSSLVPSSNVGAPPKLQTGFDQNSWTHDTFLTAPLLGTNGVVAWWDIYFSLVHPKWPFIFKKWFLQHYNDLPLILLHAMYATSLFYTSHPAEEGEFHFSVCKSVIDEAIENPDPLKTAAIMLMAVYSINSKRMKSVVSYLCIAIRFCQILGIDKDNYDTWKCAVGPIPGFENESPKEFCRALWTNLYAHDFYAIFLIGVPGSVILDIDTSYLQQYSSGSFVASCDDIRRF
jgi:hypothetical protein